MLTRTLATLTLLLTFTTGGTDPTPRTAMHRDRVQAARHARIVDDDVEGCRVPAPSPVPAAPAACSGEGQP